MIKLLFHRVSIALFSHKKKEDVSAFLVCFLFVLVRAIAFFSVHINLMGPNFYRNFMLFFCPEII